MTASKSDPSEPNRNAEGSASRGASVVPQMRGQGRGDENGRIAADMIENAARRLAAIVDEETEALRRGATQADFREFNSRKSLGLIELNRAIQLLAGVRPTLATERFLGALNFKLEANRKALKLHMEAVGEVVAVISQCVRDAESDGTYTHAFRSKGGGTK